MAYQQCKIFVHSYVASYDGEGRQKLQDDLNKWLADNPSYRVTSISHVGGDQSSFTTTVVLYEKGY